ncbi:MAG TPA: T9SS type A sorting domain-containing protein [Bacteroidia bacterium]|nr:T9SS type A sorting domain-containing protein [Bacteroidia bacterium]
MRKCKPWFPGFILIALLFTSTLNANNTTTRAGCISLQTISGNIRSLDGKLLLSAPPTISDFALIHWGDGVDQSFQLNLFPVSNYNGAYLVSIDAQHSYSPGSYTLSLECGRRVPWIRNMQNSDTSLFSLQADVVVDPNIGANSSPVNDTTNLEAEMTVVTINTISMTAPDAENDSVAWGRTIVSGAIGYVYPEMSGGGNFSLFSTLNNYEWNPQTPGLYSVCFSFEEWRLLINGNRILVGTVTREVLIDAGQVSAVTEHNITNCSVFPNPTSQIITFQFSAVPQLRSLIIYDQLGREVWREETIANSISLSVEDFAEGIYLYQVLESSNISAIGKFVVEK